MRAFLAALILLTTLPAAAQQMRDGPQTGAQLLAMCQGGSIIEVGQCRIYLDAFFDGMAHAKVSAICPPDWEISKARTMGLFVRFAKVHPEVLSQSDGAAVAAALMAEWPCI